MIFKSQKQSLVFLNTLFIACLFYSTVNAQVPKAEFRAVWVATVVNIDWPSVPGLSVEQQKNEVRNILDLHKENGMNAVIFQVRPAADAFYDSPFEPWSHYLTGEQGKAPEPYYDPLEFWVNEAHDRGMELHAWLNPYRIKQDTADILAESHVMNTHPEWTFTYGNRTYFSPAQPEVWEFVTTVVADLVSRYDIDAIHFDDYFYPYKVAGEVFPDDSLFEVYGEDYYPDRKDDWRRHNVDTIIQMLSSAIKEEKPWVKFGISPFGVWRNRTDDSFGSESRAGTTNYDGLYADVIRWQREGWIDYLMPQLYWRDDHPAVDYSTLAYWWNDAAFGRHLYFGLAPYRLNRKSDHKLWKKERYFLEHIDILRELENVNGFGMFSSKHFFREDLHKLNKMLKKKYTHYPAVVPSMPWIDNVPPEFPTNLRVVGSKIVWDISIDSNEFDTQRFFVLYRFDNDEGRNLKMPEKIIDISGKQEYDFGDKMPSGTYRVAALDRLNNESQLSDPLILK